MSTKVRFIQSVSGMGPSPCGIQYPNFYFSEGFVGTLTDDRIAQAWVDSGICVLAEPDDQCRPPKPEFAVAVSPEQATLTNAQSVARRGPGRPRRDVVVPVIDTEAEAE